MYLNPIFMGKTAHHYHNIDLRHVDDVFGISGSYSKIQNETVNPQTWQWSDSDRLFLQAIKELHQQGIKILLDMNFHSVHRENPFFQDVLKNGQKSPFFHWFDSKRWGDGPHDIDYWTWDRWIGGNEMPLFRVQENLNYPDDLRYFLLSIAKRWLCPNGDPNSGVDGFRIDSPESLPVFFEWDLHDLMKEIKPEAVLINENWHRTALYNIANLYDANGDMEWTEQLYNYFIGKKKNLPEYLEYTNELFHFGVMQTVMSSWHALGNHDTVRFAGALANPQLSLHPYLHPYDHVQEPQNSTWQQLMQAVVYQFTSFGAPYIYYGDEIGMWSKSDPFNRQPMAWHTPDRELWKFYRKIIAIRKKFLVLRRGNYELLDLEEDQGLFGFKRSLSGQEMWMVFNRSSEEKTFTLPVDHKYEGKKIINCLNPDQVEWKESDQNGLQPCILDANIGYLVKDGQLHLQIKPWESMIFIPQTHISTQL